MGGHTRWASLSYVIFPPPLSEEIQFSNFKWIISHPRDKTLLLLNFTALFVYDINRHTQHKLSYTDTSVHQQAKSTPNNFRNRHWGIQQHLWEKSPTKAVRAWEEWRRDCRPEHIYITNYQVYCKGYELHKLIKNVSYTRK